jgi:suppressor of ftsI
MMKRLLFTALLSITLLSCQKQTSGSQSDATAGEIHMAEMMGITVEEMRNQTPEEHMKMMMNMSKGNEGNEGREDFFPGKGIDISSLPEAQPSKVIDVEDGETIELNPTLVKKTIHDTTFAMYGYNGQIPGPLIKAKQGATITVNVRNEIDMPTTIHWHGVRLANAHDGVPDVTQEVIQPDGTFTYTVKLPDEGIYWYHPHVREDIQQDMGLYGNLLVAPTSDEAYGEVHQEAILMLDDIALDDAGNLIPYGTDDATHPLMGRFGTTMLINGETDYNLQVAQGAIVRFYLTNVANTRTFRLRFDDAKMKRVGSDVGRYEREEWVDDITIAPAERYIVEVLFHRPGTFSLQHISAQKTYNLGTITITDEKANAPLSGTFTTLKTYDNVSEDIDTFRDAFDRPVDKTLHLFVEMHMDHSMMAMEDEDGSTVLTTGDETGIEWEDAMPMMNEMSTKANTQWKLIDEGSKAENMDIDWTFPKGSVAKIRIINDEDSDHPMQHPIHFHGQRFLILDVDGKRQENFVWKDTVLVPRGSTVDLLFDMSNPGNWMFHCHIAEHLTNGMMGMLRVTE